MVANLPFLQQVRTRLLRQQQLNAIGFFVPLAISSWVCGRLLSHIGFFPQLLSFLPPLICCGFLGVALWKAQAAVGLETAALFVDDKIGGKDRFLTLTTVSQSTTRESLYRVIQLQAERIAGSFRLKQDLPFSLDRRVFFSVGGALCSLLLLLYVERIYPSFSTSSQDGFTRSQTETSDETIKALEAVAHRLMQKTSAPQEQMIGAQLSALAQQLKDPSLSPQEKQQLVKETQKRLPLDFPFPQLLPFDLQIFASKSKDGQGDGSEKHDSQEGNAPSANSDPKDGQSKKPTSTSTRGNEPQQNVEQNGEKSDQSQTPKPRQDGGGITFNFPQDQQKGQEQSPHDSSEVGPQSAQEPVKNDLAPGTDPTRSGGDQNDQEQSQKGNKGNTIGEEQNQQSKGEGAVGQGKGEHVPKPGAQPGGGFLTEDAQFVKVRVPMGQEAQAADEGARTSNNGLTIPKTAYSNAPLKESAPEQAQMKQPIPLEYRSILKD